MAKIALAKAILDDPSPNAMLYSRVITKTFVFYGWIILIVGTLGVTVGTITGSLALAKIGRQ